MSQVTELATAQLSATDTLTIELIEADEIPAVVIIRGPPSRSCYTRTGSPLLLRSLLVHSLPLS